MNSWTALLLGLALAWNGPAGAISPEAPPTRVAPEAGARQPQAAVDREGRIFVAYGVGDLIRCARSTDGGKTFESADVGRAGALSLGMRRGPRVAVAGKVLVVSAVAGAQGQGKDGDLLTWRSADLGRTWSGPTRVNSVEGSAREGLHGMASGPDGSTYCVWLDLRARATELYGARSKDGGATWEPDHLVYKSPGGSICQCCHPSVAYDLSGDLHVLWRNSLRGDRDLYLIRSADGGSTFGPAEKLGRESWALNACPMDGGMLAIGPGGRVETAWMRAGAVFEARPGEPERRLGRGVQVWTAFGPGGPVTAWLVARPGRLLVEVPGSRDPLTIAEDAVDPVVAAGTDGRGPVIVAWEGKAGGIFARTLEPAKASTSR